MTAPTGWHTNSQGVHVTQVMCGWLSPITFFLHPATGGKKALPARVVLDANPHQWVEDPDLLRAVAQRCLEAADWYDAVLAPEPATDPQLTIHDYLPEATSD